jgi:hypothetical protein
MGEHVIVNPLNSQRFRLFLNELINGNDFRNRWMVYTLLFSLKSVDCWRLDVLSIYIIVSNFRVLFK